MKTFPHTYSMSGHQGAGCADVEHWGWLASLLLGSPASLGTEVPTLLNHRKRIQPGRFHSCKNICLHKEFSSPANTEGVFELFGPYQTSLIFFFFLWRESHRSSLFLDVPSSMRPKPYPTLIQSLIAFPTSIFSE